MTAVWAAILGASLGCYGLKLAGVSLPESVLSQPRVQRIAGLLPVAMLAALIVTDLFGALCDAAAQRGLSPCLEFMPFRSLKTLGDARQVIRAAGRPNGLICLDALHLARSGGTLSDLTTLEPALIGDRKAHV